MVKKKVLEGIKEEILLLFMVTVVIIVGVFGLYFLKKYSLKNKYICSYLGGLWMRKERDLEHRCYTYEEFYR